MSICIVAGNVLLAGQAYTIQVARAVPSERGLMLVVGEEMRTCTHSNLMGQVNSVCNQYIGQEVTPTQ